MPRACTICTSAERDAIDRLQKGTVLLTGLLETQQA